jgi:hypothetical protein
MRITITKDDGTSVETNTIAIARRLNSNVVDNMCDGLLSKSDMPWDEAEFINITIDTVDAMFRDVEIS